MQIDYKDAPITTMASIQTQLNATLEEGELERTVCSVAEKSWFEVCEEADEDMTNRSSAAEMASESPVENEADDSSTGSINTSDRSNGSEREILVSFLDASNEAKFERLVKEEKIKTSFKRCLSPTSASKSSDAKRATGSPSDEIEHRERDASPDSSERSDSSAGKRAREFETDAGVLERRQKQIDYGKNTLGYDLYSKQVPREKRTPAHPWTPQKNFKYSRRAFDGLVKIWRKKLHCYDPSSMNYNGSNDDAGKGV